MRLSGRPASLVTSLVVGALVAIAPLGRSEAQPPAAKKKVPAASKGKAERASGVILKVEQVKGAGKGGGGIKLSVNTNAVWRDWARDQINDKPTDSAAKDADEGKNSVATLGEPADANSTIVVAVPASAPVETRFRALDDEASDGTKAPGGEKPGAVKPVRFRLQDLKPGLFVAVDFEGTGKDDSAKRIIVIRPIDDLNVKPKAEPAGTKGVK